MENFGYVFLKALEGLFIDRMEQNEDITARFMNDEEFQATVGKHLLRTVYNQVRSEAETAAAPAGEPFERVEPQEEDKYRTCVPLFTLQAAAGTFSAEQHVEPDGWVVPRTSRRLGPGMFIAQVVGQSMEPRIPDGAYCLFRRPVEGTRQGRVVLVELRDRADPATGNRYTVKVYESEKATEGDSWRHEHITLRPLNPAVEPIVLASADDLDVVAELSEVLGSRA